MFKHFPRESHVKPSGCGGHLGYPVYSENTQLVQNHVVAILNIQSIQKTHNWYRTMLWPSWISSLFRKHTIGTEPCGGHLGYSVYSENTQLVQNYVVAILDIQSIQKTHNWYRTMWWPSWIFSLFRKHRIGTEPCCGHLGYPVYSENTQLVQNHVVAILDIQSIQKTHNWYRTMWCPSWIFSLFRKHTIGTELCYGHLGYSVYSENTQLVQNHVVAILDIQSIQKTHNWYRTMWWPSWIFSLFRKHTIGT